MAPDWIYQKLSKIRTTRICGIKQNPTAQKVKIPKGRNSPTLIASSVEGSTHSPEICRRGQAQRAFQTSSPMASVGEDRCVQLPFEIILEFLEELSSLPRGDAGVWKASDASSNLSQDDRPPARREVGYSSYMCKWELPKHRRPQK